MQNRPLRSSGVRLAAVCETRLTKQMCRRFMRRPRQIDSLLQQRNVKKSVYVFTTGRKLHDNRSRNIFDEQNHWLRSDDVAFCHDRWAKLRKREDRRKGMCDRPGYTRPTLQSANNIDIPERLHLPERKPLPAMTDTAPRFYRSVEGRYRESLRLKDYVSDLRKNFYANYTNSVKNTRLWHDRKAMADEEKELLLRTKAHDESFYGYETFLWIDHMTAQDSLSAMEDHKLYTNELTEKLVSIAGTHRKLTLEMYVYEEKWRYYKVLEAFLCRISPYSWRKEHDLIYFRKENDSMVQYREFSDVHKRYKLASTGTVASLDSLLNLYIEDTETQSRPMLYLTELKQIEAVFRHLEFMNMNLAVQNELLYIPLNYLTETIAATTIMYESEISYLQDQIDFLENAIRWKQIKIEENKIAAWKDLHGPMTKLMSLPNLYMHMYLELAFLATVSVYTSDQTMLKLGAAVMKRYNQLMIRMEAVKPRVVMETEAKHYANKQHLLKIANRAKQEYRVGRRVIYRYHVAIDPIFVKHGRPLVKRSTPAEEPVPPPPPPIILTDEQKDYLTYFTDYYWPLDDVRKYSPSL